ncbi:dual specificity protein phosphatase [Cytophagaceae bacterium DM2B3-1]|uniref:Dual specificity protein phosphatase n=1 Tax=Xanthocytophaga flava TaxID=3048013 RepID=A0ABT7CUK7_9BACT|nr:dual specificity protein phosphatase [Xanthocytophaga flavus]MDJ1470474.1 dual specificity protein phosphatase [Xanthocytophaga flavus]MDJ1496314.1 dual specificity protein phosphatase [Xanthocytophaga flavus]
MEQSKYHWITDHIALGEEPDLKMIDQLKKENVKKILDLRTWEQRDIEFQNEVQQQFFYQNVSIVDGKPVSIETISSCIRFISESVPKERIYLHCQRGISRSPMILMCYLIYKGYNGLASHNLIKSKRKCIWININFLDSILHYEDQIIDLRGRKRKLDKDVYESIRNQSYRKLYDFLKRVLKNRETASFYQIAISPEGIIDLDSLITLLFTRYEFRTWVNKDSLFHMMNRINCPMLKGVNNSVLLNE